MNQDYLENFREDVMQLLDSLKKHDEDAGEFDTAWLVIENEGDFVLYHKFVNPLDGEEFNDDVAEFDINGNFDINNYFCDATQAHLILSVAQMLIDTEAGDEMTGFA